MLLAFMYFIDTFVCKCRSLKANHLLFSPLESKKAWSKQERVAIFQEFGEDFIKTNVLPGKAAIEQAKARNVALEEREWKNIIVKLKVNQKTCLVVL